MGFRPDCRRYGMDFAFSPVKGKKMQKENSRTGRRGIHRLPPVPASVERRARSLLRGHTRHRRFAAAARHAAAPGIPVRPPQHRQRIRHPLRRDLQPRGALARALQQGAARRVAQGQHTGVDKRPRHGPFGARTPSSTHPPETSTARDTATPRSRRRTVVRHTAPSPKANGRRGPAPRLPV